MATTAAKFSITSGRGKFRGRATDISTFSATEQAVPLDPSSTAGNVGTLTVGLVEESGSRLLYENTVKLEDNYRGKLEGQITQVTSNDSRWANNPDLQWGEDGVLGLDIADKMNLLVVDRRAYPFTGTLAEAIIYYLSLVGIDSANEYKIDETLEEIDVDLPGWYGEVWLNLKRLAIAYNLDISQVSGYVYFRPIRQYEAVIARDSQRQWSIGAGKMAASIEMTYFNNVYREDTLVYPLGGWSENIDDASGFMGALEAGETQVKTIPTPNVSLLSIEQPVVQNFVDRYENDSSVYAAIGGDGLPITAAQWIAGGGSLTVEIGEDTQSIVVTVRAPEAVEFAPYTIAVGSGNGNTYNSLRLVGTGVIQTPVTKTYVTGVPEDKVSQDVIQINDNEFITDVDQFHLLMSRALAAYSLPAQKVSTTASYINKRGQTGEIVSQTINYVDAYYSGYTIDQVDAMWAGDSIDDNTAFFQNMLIDNFDNQVFGNLGGTRVPLRDNYYRITNASVTPSTLSYDAEYDTLLDDFDSKYVGKTINEVDSLFSGYTLDEQVLNAMGNP